MLQHRFGAPLAVCLALAGLGVPHAQEKDPLTTPRDAALTWIQSGQFRVTVTNTGRISDMLNPLADDIQLNSEYELCTALGGYEASTDFGYAGHSQPNGQGTLPLWVMARTADNRWQIKWTYTFDTSENELLLTAAVKRLLAPNAWARLEVGHDFDLTHAHSQDAYDHSRRQVWQRSTDDPKNALTMLTMTPSFAYAAVATPHGMMYTDDDCYPLSASHWFPMPGTLDVDAVVTHDLGTVNAGATKTIKIQYRRQ